MKLLEYINEFKGEFHSLEGLKFGLTESQSQVHVDLTVNAAMSFLQQLMMSGKLAEIQSLASGGPEALRNSPHFEQLISTCAQSYYGLDWEMDRKKVLAESILGFVLLKLREKFIAGGYESNASGVMKFLGLNTGLLGTMGGMFGRFFK